MATKVRFASSVSYGIGVQNRYSAFLDDEDGFGHSMVASVATKHHATGIIADHQTANKQKSPAQNSAKSNNSSNVKSNGKLIGTNNKQQSQDQLKSQADQRKRSVEGVDNNNKQRQRAGQQQQQGGNYVQQPRQQANNKHGNNNQESNANNSNNRFARTQTNKNSNHHHQSNASHNHQQQQGNNHSYHNKENGDQVGQQHGKFRGINNNSNYNNQRPNNRRQFNNEDKNKDSNQIEDGQVNSLASPTGGVRSNEEEKRRRQRKRVFDLKFKDPQKREARRQQTAASELSNATSHQAEQTQGENNNNNITNNSSAGFNKGQRFNQRRQIGEGQRTQDDANRGFRGMNSGGRGRGRRPEQGGPAESAANGERRVDGQQQQHANRIQRVGDRPQRNRNGFGTDSRGSRGSRGDEQGKFERDSDRQKPIPNFSDKLDFPSLAS